MRAPKPNPGDVVHLRPCDGVGLAFVAGCAGLTALGLALSSRPGLAAWAAGQLLLAVAMLQWFVILHEAGHETLFRTRWLHRIIGHLAGAFALIPFQSWRRVHGLHHKWTGWQDLDPTTASLVPRARGRAERAVVRFCWRYWVPVFSVVYRISNYWLPSRLRRICPEPRHQRAIMANLAVVAAGYAAVIGLLGPLESARLLGVATLLSLVAQDPLILSQHTHIPQGVSAGCPVTAYHAVEQDVFTRSLVFPAWLGRGVLMNIGAHELHHMYPYVPGYRLHQIACPTDNTVNWWHWLRRTKRIPGDVFLFENRDRSGLSV